MSISVDLTKSTQVVVDLTKEKGIADQKAQVVLAIDYSGSMSNLYASGVVQKVIERLVPIAMAFDDDGSMEVYIFHNGVRKGADVTVANLDGYVKKFINGSMGGTSYAPVINAIIKDHTTSTPTGMLGKLFGSSKPKEINLPTYVIFITDGENDDSRDTEAAMREASKQGVFFQFVGISSSGNSRFAQLQKLDDMTGRLIDNANFFQLSNNQLTSLEDKQLYDKLLTEFPSWLTLAKTNNLIK